MLTRAPGSRLVLVLLLSLVASTARSSAQPAQEYYSTGYEAARARFVAAAESVAARWPAAARRSFAIPSKKGEDLTVDYLYLPAKKQPRELVVLLSGVHGMEAFAASAIQLMFLEEFGGKLSGEQTGYLLVHGLNAYGFKHYRRATENNVNLNRNFSTKPDLYHTANKAYTTLAKLLQPEGPVHGTSSNFVVTAIEIGRRLISGKFTMADLNEAIGQGQYEHAAGIEYGGSQAEPQVADFLAQLKATAHAYHDVVLLDLHTGLGDAYQLHMMPGDVEGVADPALFARLFDRKADADLYQYTPNDTAGFYHTHGDVNNCLAELRDPSQRVVALTMEFGTVGASPLAKLQTLNRLILENQGFHNGYTRPGLELEVRKLFSELFFPESPDWRRNVISRSRQVFARMLSRMGALR